MCNCIAIWFSIDRFKGAVAGFNILTVAAEEEAEGEEDEEDEDWGIIIQKNRFQIKRESVKEMMVLKFIELILNSD